MKAGSRRPAVSYANAIKSARQATLEVSLKQILTHEEQEIIEDLIMKICEGWTAKLVFTAIRFRSGLILVDCATEDMADYSP